MTKITVEAGIEASGVVHTYEQISVILEGSLECTIGETTKRLKEGDAFYVPAGVPHGAKILETPTVICESLTAPSQVHDQVWKEYGVPVGKAGP